MSLRVFEAFAGVGTQRMALRNLGIPHEVVGISEINPFALMSYRAIHGDCPNFGDISKINPKNLPDFDLFTYSFPCQDLSTAGKQRGMIRGETRSGLLYECERIIEVKRPKYLLLENVKNLVGKSFKAAFDDWLNYLEGLGYTNYWKILNAKDYGIPQHRERVFVISILGEHEPYEFPATQPLKTKWMDFLDEEVEDSLYLKRNYQSVEDFPLLDPSLIEKQPLIQDTFESLTIGSPRIEKLFNINPSGKGMNGFVFDGRGLCPTVTTNKGEGLKVLIEKPIGTLVNVGENGWGYRPLSSSPASVVGSWVYPISPFLALPSEPISLDLLPNPNFKTVTITPSDWARHQAFSSSPSDLTSGLVTLLIARKLSSKESWRLMGMTDEDYQKAKAAGVSNTQLFYQAGNAIVVNVLEAIFKELFL